MHFKKRIRREIIKSGKLMAMWLSAIAKRLNAKSFTVLVLKLEFTAFLIVIAARNVRIKKRRMET